MPCKLTCAKGLGESGPLSSWAMLSAATCIARISRRPGPVCRWAVFLLQCGQHLLARIVVHEQLAPSVWIASLWSKSKVSVEPLMLTTLGLDAWLLPQTQAQQACGCGCVWICVNVTSLNAKCFAERAQTLKGLFGRSGSSKTVCSLRCLVVLLLILLRRAGSHLHALPASSILVLANDRRPRKLVFLGALAYPCVALARGLPRVSTLAEPLPLPANAVY